MKYLDYIDEWLKYKESEYSFSTLKTYKGLINKHYEIFRLY
nr:MAG TPA: integrase [Caudoviricetes sp.]